MAAPLAMFSFNIVNLAPIGWGRVKMGRVAGLPHRMLQRGIQYLMRAPEKGLAAFAW